MKQVSVFEFVMVVAGIAVITAIAVLWIGVLLEPSVGAWNAAIIGFIVGGSAALYSGYSYAKVRLFNAD